MAKSVDAGDLKSPGHKPCGFESRSGHQLIRVLPAVVSRLCGRRVPRSIHCHHSVIQVSRIFRDFVASLRVRWPPDDGRGWRLRFKCTPRRMTFAAATVATPSRFFVPDILVHRLLRVALARLPSFPRALAVAGPSLLGLV